jgi:hypothetical protein
MLIKAYIFKNIIFSDIFENSLKVSIYHSYINNKHI